MRSVLLGNGVPTMRGRLGAVGAAPLLCLLGIAVLAALPVMLAPFQLRVGQLMFYSAGLALAWNILGGFAGYHSFGHAAFIGIGAFSAGLMEAQFPSLPPLQRLGVGLLAGAATCAVISALLAYPILRLRGTFFAIAMLGVSHVAGELNTTVDVFQGSMGLMFAEIVPDDWDPQWFYYELYLNVASGILAISWALRRSRFGYGLLSIREDEDTARMLGVPTERYKSLAFVLSAVLTGVLGAIYAHSLGYVTTASLYRDDTNLSLIVFALLGGIGTLAGPIIGAFLIVVLTHVVLSDFPDVHLFAMGLILVLLVLVAPDGLIGLGRRLLRRGGAGRAP